MQARRKWAFGLLGAMTAAAALGVACGNGGGASGSGTPDASPSVVDTGPPPNLGDAGPPDVFVPSGTLTLQPANSTLDVPPATTVQFQAYEGNDPAPVAATWSVDQQSLGTIDATGLFTATGAAGGSLTIYAQAGQSAGQTTLRIRLHVTDYPPGLDGGVLGALQEGGAADPEFLWLYPYDQTVFPRGLPPPRLQWTETAPDWVYVTASAQNLDYKGVFAPTNSDGVKSVPNDGGPPAQLDLPASAWNAITLSAGASDPVRVQVTKMDSAGQVTGPVGETWTVAQGSLKGIVYYNSYDSPLAQGDAGSQNDMGAVMRLRVGAAQPEVFIGGSAKGSCTVCHTLSANGGVMALSAGHTYDAVYRVTADASTPEGPSSTQPDNVYSFSALTPDGKYLLSCGSTGLDAGATDGGPVSIADYGPNPVSMTHELSSRLFATEDGGVVGSIPNVAKALTPAFSPDGTKLAFNRYEPGQDQRLAVVSFDESTLTFGAYKDVFVEPGFYLSWPTFLPDSQNFVFMVSSDTDQYSTYQQGSFRDANGELLFFMPSVSDVAHLRAAMGQHRILTDAGTTGYATYLLNPNGTFANQDRLKNYEPTALPVAAAGYYWVVFTSRRSYGNTIDNSVPNDTPPEVKPKKLWVTAIDINGTPGADWSHPAFYLPGQELGGGNIRAFWTLPPCQANGASCQAGTDCCNGFCRQVEGDAGASTTDAGPAFACVAPPTGCANVDEKCATDADCCTSAMSGIHCIAGFCAIPTPK